MMQVDSCLFFSSLVLARVLLPLCAKVHELMGVALRLMTPRYGMKGAVPTLFVEL